MGEITTNAQSIRFRVTIVALGSCIALSSAEAVEAREEPRVLLWWSNAERKRESG